MPIHWGMSALEKQGMLGGFARTNMKCKSGTWPDCNTNGQGGYVVLWDFSSGAPAQSHDAIGAYSKYELQLMGLYTAAELANEPPIVTCEGVPSQQQYQSGTDVEVTCTNISKWTSAQVNEG